MAMGVGSGPAGGYEQQPTWAGAKKKIMGKGKGQSKKVAKAKLKPPKKP